MDFPRSIFLGAPERMLRRITDQIAVTEKECRATKQTQICLHAGPTPSVWCPHPCGKWHLFPVSYFICFLKEDSLSPILRRSACASERGDQGSRLKSLRVRQSRGNGLNTEPTLTTSSLHPSTRLYVPNTLSILVQSLLLSRI